ncbi:MAG: deoxynucleoside kinase [Deltaproteobacteria bacterium CG11_big_fil_rev_8_21_14_0_20_47_16]|nr:MAG: deoxynucleoside kinase [Deltaproteobacteria bacterium CG11_big_fil_rev_8_21_14_0_20_47_16]
MSDLELHHRYIAVDGPIGAGKTTLVKMLAEDLGGQPIFEPAEKNPFLGDFYKDRTRNAFKTQLFFLLNRYQQQVELAQQDLFSNITLCDYTFAKDLIFAQINLNPDEMKLYEMIYTLLSARLPKPDFVIYMQANPKVLTERIKMRGATYEKGITEDYLEMLTEAYNNYFFNYNETPLLVVNSSDLDYVKNAQDWEDLKRAILEHKQGTAHYHYVSRG